MFTRHICFVKNDILSPIIVGEKTTILTRSDEYRGTVYYQVAIDTCMQHVLMYKFWNITFLFPDEQSSAVFFLSHSTLLFLAGQDCQSAIIN